MKDNFKITGCSMGCMYSEIVPIDKCLCPCKGRMHGMMVERNFPVKCSPKVEKRCKAGLEDGECSCACGGVNHGLYGGIPDFDTIKINEYKV